MAALVLALVAVYAAVWLPRVRGGVFAACYTGGFVNALLEDAEPLGHIWLAGEPLEREHLSLWYYPVAWLVRATGAPTLSVLAYLPLLLIPAGALSQYYWFRTLVERRAVALGATAMGFVTLQPTLLEDSFSEQFVAIFILIPWTVVFLSKALRDRAWWSADAFVGGVLFGLLFLCQRGWALWLLILLAIYITLRTFSERRIPGRELALLALVAAITAAMGYQFLLDSIAYCADSAGKNPYYANAAKWIWWPLPFWPMLRPAALFSWPQLTGMLAAMVLSALALPDAWRWHQEPGWLVLMAAWILHVAIYLTPFGYLVGRLLTFGFAGQFFMPGNFPLLLLGVAVGIQRLLGILERSALSPWHGVLSWTGYAGASAFGLFVYASVLTDDWIPAQEFLSKPLVAYLTEKTPESSVILSDPMTSFYIPLLTQRRVPYVRATATHANHAARLSDASQMLDPGVPIDEAMACIAERDISHVVVNPRYWSPRPSAAAERNFGVFMPDSPEALAQRFRSIPGVREVALPGQISVFELEGTAVR